MDHARIESCLSQVMRISKWLRTSSNENVISFLQFWQTEFYNDDKTNSNTIGDLISSIILQTYATILNENKITGLLHFCNESQHKTMTSTATTLNQKKQQEQEQRKTKKQDYPCTKRIKFKHCYFALLSLPFDIFNEIGWYLHKNEALNLGYCSHEYYNATQNIQFLKTSGFYNLQFNRKKLEEIVNKNIDPWNWSVGCSSTLTLTNKARVRSPFSEKLLCHLNNGEKSNWWNVLQSSIRELRVVNGGIIMLPLLNVETLFGSTSQSQLQLQHQRDGEYRFRERAPIDIKFDNVWQHRMNARGIRRKDQIDGEKRDKGSRAELKQFGMNYSEYYKRVMKNKSVIRKINVIYILNTPNLCVESTYEAIKYFQPNYKGLIFKKTKFLLSNLQSFIRIFHRDLVRLEFSQVLFEYGRILSQCLNAVKHDGHVLCINNKIIDELFDQEDAYYMKTFLGTPENVSQLAYVNDRILTNVMAFSMDKFVSNGTVGRYRGAARNLVHETCLIILEHWLLRLLDNYNKSWINESLLKNKHDNTIIITGEEEKQEEEALAAKCVYGDTNELQLERLKSIMIGIHQPNIEELRICDIMNHGKELLYHFNRIFKFKIVYRLLNWKKSVKKLTISFTIPCYVNDARADIDNTAAARQRQIQMNQFTTVMINIVEHFDNLKLLIIEPKLSSSDLIKRDKKDDERHYDTDSDYDDIKIFGTASTVIGDVNSPDQSHDSMEEKKGNMTNNVIDCDEKKKDFDEHTQRLNKFVFNIEQWINTFELELESNMSQMIDKFKNNDNKSFKLTFRLIIGNLDHNNPINMYDYLKAKNIAQVREMVEDVYSKRSEMFRFSSKEINIMRNDSKNEDLRNKVERCESYWDILTNMKQILVLCIKEFTDDVRNKSFLIQHHVSILKIPPLSERDDL